MLINIDSKIPNLALAKIAKYHQDKGDEVIWDMPLISCDKTYVSCVFDWNKHKCTEWEGIAEIGGSGYSLDIVLPQDIEQIQPKLNLGFATRGCIRNCPFCIVPRKEGKIRIVGDLYDIWDGQAKMVVFIDNNILAKPKHFLKICAQIKQESLMVDFNQGLDCRLLTKELCQALLSIRNKELRFAFDDISVKPAVLRAISILKNCGQKDWQSRWYVYVGPKHTVGDVLERMNILWQHKQGVYVMRDRAVYGDPRLIAVAAWGNTASVFKTRTFAQSLELKRQKPYRKYFDYEAETPMFPRKNTNADS